MFESLVWKDAIHGKQPIDKINYKAADEFYPCEVLCASGNYLLIAPLFFAPIWVVSNLVQIAEDNYYELIEEKENWEAVYNATNALLNSRKKEKK